MKSLVIATAASMFALGAFAAPAPADKSVGVATVQANGGPQGTYGEGDPATAWTHDQWNKERWGKMTDSDRASYRERHQSWWSKQTPEQRAAWRDQHKGQTNYMDPNWESAKTY